MRMWEIREGHTSEGRYPWKRGYGEMDNPGARGRGMGHVKEEDLKEAYECGYEDGYEEAMKEFEHKSYGRMKRY